MIADWLDDLVNSARDALAYVIATIAIGWLYTPVEWLA